MGSVSQGIRPALTGATGPPRDAKTRDQRLELGHDGRAQRWLVVHSHAALERAEAPGNNARQREEAARAQPLLHLPAPRVETPAMAQEALAELARSWTYHQVESDTLIAHQREARPGRPTPHTPLKALAWPIQAHAGPEQEALAHRKPGHAGCVLGTNRDASELRDTEVLQADKGQARVEGGFRLLNAPLLCVSSWCVKKPCRLQGRSMVMTRA
jgi:transposase